MEGEGGREREWGYTVGRTMFETDRLPSGWAERLNRMDEVWVPTEHHRKIFEEAKVRNIRVVGQGIDADQWSPDQADPMAWEVLDSYKQCNEDDVKFLSVFKWEKRKGHDILLPAFWEAFPPPTGASVAEGSSRGACLIVVTSLYHTEPEEVMGDIARYWNEATSQPARDFRNMQRVILLNGLSETELIAVFKSVDAFVLPSRGEGWGRPYMEAMSMGLPVVATNWSGPTAFVTEENGYLLPIQGLVDAGLDAFPGHKWADPDRVALKEILARIRDDPGERKRKGRQARQDVLDRWSHKKVAADVTKELERIAAAKALSAG